MWRFLPASALLACSDYLLKEEPVPEVAALEVSPDAIALAGACEDASAEVVLTSVGTATVVVTALALEGEGWVLPAVPLPLSLDPGEARGVPLMGGPGRATLRVTSTDAERPVVEVPLTLSANTHPSAMVTAPYEDQHVPEEGPLVLEGFVSDAEDPLDRLVVTWTSSVAGTLGTSIPEADGRVRWEWPADARPPGPQTLQLLAADTCGDVGENTVYYCQDGPWTYEAVTFSAWTEAGTATRGDAELVLGGVADTAGAMFAASEILDARGLSATLSFEASGVNGLALVLLDTDRRVTYLGGDGCGLGYGGGVDCSSGEPLPGWAVELDLVADPGVDTSPGPHLAFTVDGDVTLPRLEAPVPALDAGLHTLTVVVVAPRVTVSLDGAVVLDGDVPDALDFVGVLGVTTSTSGEAGEVRVHEAVFTDPGCD